MIPRIAILFAFMFFVTDGVQAASGLSCREAFGLAPFPPGFGLSSHDHAVALGLENVGPLVAPLAEAIGLVEQIKSPAEVQRLFPSVAPSDGPHAAEFPIAFYNKYLATKSVDVELVQVSFARLKDALPGTRASDEALAIVAFVSVESRSRAKNVPGAKAHKTSDFDSGRLIETALLKARASGPLPSFGEFIRHSDNAFISFAIAARQFAIQTKAEGRGAEPVWNNDQASESYGLELGARIADAPNLSFEQRIDLAIQILESDLVRDGAPYLTSALAHRNLSRNNNKWLGIGLHYMGWIEQEFDRYRTRVGEDEPLKESLQDFAKGFCMEEESKHVSFLVSVLEAVKQGKIKASTAGAEATRANLIAALQSLGHKVKDEVKAHARQERDAQRLALQLKLAQQPAAAPVVTHKKSSIASPKFHAPNQTRAAKREQRRLNELRAAGKLPASAADAKPPIEETLDVSNEAQLIGLEFASIEVGKRYAFMFNNPAQDSASRFSVPDVQFVEFTKTFVDTFKAKGLDLTLWIRTFLIGKITDKMSIGVKHIVASRNNRSIWEIRSKYLGNKFRIMIEFHEESRTWRWMEIVNHNEVETFLKRHGLKN